MAATFEALATVTVGSGGAADITFSSIPQTYTDLLVKVSGRSNRGGGDTNDGVKIQFNTTGDTNQSSRYLQGSGTSATSGTFANNHIGLIPTTQATSSTFGNLECYIPNYAGSSNKSTSTDAVTENNATEAYAWLAAGLWSDTAAITSVKLISSTGNNFVQYSTATLYGIKNS